MLARVLLGLVLAVLSATVSAAATSDASLVVKVPLEHSRGSTAGSPNNTDKWLGIPFAQSPVGNLRFKSPVAITKPSHSVQDANQFGNACPQRPSDTLGAPLGEDCLFLNVWRPAGTRADAKLPVLVWFYVSLLPTEVTYPFSDFIHSGWSIYGRSRLQPFIRPNAANISKPIVFVSINYRVNTFGFLASSHVPIEDLDAGLQDQRLALAFLQDNVAAFGGDPNKVTIWGQSAGAGSAEAQIVFPAKQSHFRAAIFDSSTGPFKTAPPASTYDEPGKPYALLTEAVGCTSGPGSFECLQQVPFEV
ncbi:uncharacterized protein PHACADRAFT_190672 [Phanerochaete carnosa HHB-10118-sp]|uniref:Carboxylic ester hydrolase n=1 Tax=Phanerochaete carnosa (strain HHB-10118-sp) TaxID=650164 RepID=K5WC30_PHACS|nr:uncharacterized protein PHACADRAFT_190672 [Phanerochaete carnosa HHB-10118-sp]EKM61503.1 hypothetical protein PHACADRAFT_190672 [Phanerochaete carnosa HHB-10118-sp]